MLKNRKKVLCIKNKEKLYIVIVILLIYISFSLAKNNQQKIMNKNVVDIIIKKITKKELIAPKIVNKTISDIYKNPIEYLKFYPINKKQNRNNVSISEIKEKEDPAYQPIIYIYNTHQTEEYASNYNLEYNINPTVTIVNYILESYFNDSNYKTYVEESSIKEILNANKWNYSSSYKASKILIEKRKNETNSFKYFIDVHRDSLKKDKTTVTINNKEYAKILFIIGLENPAYQQNLDFTNKINECLNTKYPTLSKGIYKKAGPGVKGVYNQDISPYAILVEMGGYENTIPEVLNSSLAFGECFLEVIKNNEIKSTN